MNFAPMKQTEIAENGDVIEIIDEPLVVTDVDAYKEELRKLPEVQNLTSEIDPNNSNTILMFGQKPSQGLSQITDQLMATTKRVNAQEASEMMVKLTKLMDKFDVQELENINTEERPTFVQKLFNKVKMTLDELFAKYEDMGREVDGIYQILTKYESQILKSQDDLKKLYEANTTFYEELEKYIVAGELGKEEIQNYRKQVEASPNLSDLDRQNELQRLDMLVEMLDTRVYDLRIAEQVAMQTAPMIQMQMRSNFDLARKIKSSFIITLPIFKQCLIQAINLKRQEIQARSIKQLDDKTKELLERNAQNTARQSVQTAKMASGSSVPIETLRKNYDIIKNGTEEVKRIQAEQAQKRETDTVELENMKQQMKASGLLSAPL